MKLIALLSIVALNSVAQDSIPTNKHFWKTVTTHAAPEKIWAIWTDVENWNESDVGLRSATISETFKLNAKGIITSLEGRKSKFTVVDFHPNKSYTFKTKLPLSNLYIKRSLEVADGKTLFKHEVWFKGLTAGIFAKLFGPKFRELLPQAMEKIKAIAEAH